MISPYWKIEIDERYEHLTTIEQDREPVHGILIYSNTTYLSFKKIDPQPRN